MGTGQDRAQERVVEQLLLRQEPRAPARPDQHVAVRQRVEVGDVVRRHQERAFGRDVFGALEAPVEPEGDGRPERALRQREPWLELRHQLPSHARLAGRAPGAPRPGRGYPTLVRVLAVPVKSLERAKGRLEGSGLTSLQAEVEKGFTGPTTPWTAKDTDRVRQLVARRARRRR